MKKILSAILALTMILALVAAMGISASAADLYESAKDGDVLYEVNFKGDDVYSPSIFYSAVENSLDVVVSDDGSSVTATYLSSTKARAFFGGTVKGLTYGEGKTYTITMKTAIAYTTNDDGSVKGSNNGGVFINMPKDTSAEAMAAQKFNDRMFGYYGCPNYQHIFSYGAGNKATASLKSSNSGYFKDNLATIDENGFVDLTFVVDGKTMTIYINNVYIDEANVFTEGMVEAAGNLGISAYLYNTNASITIKDAKIYKGNLVTAPTYPDYYVEGSLAAEYETAKTGDLLFAADFTRNDTVFAPRYNSSNANMMTLTFDPENKSYIKFQHGSSDGAVYYGSNVSGLEIDSETRYTTEWKVKSGSGNSGLCFANPTGLPYNNSMNIYGVFTAGKKFASQHGGTKITNGVMAEVGTDGYVKIDDIANDADGFATLRVEMYGYNATVYYLNTEGQWVKYNEFDMTNTTKIDGTATYPHDTGFQLCVGFYLYNKNMSAEYKDINIYKGLLITDPEGKLDPVITEPAPETTEPAESGKTGDSSIIFAVIAVVAVAGVAVVAKRREN